MAAPDMGQDMGVAYGKGESDEERYARAEEETISRLREWIARRDERRRLLLAEQEHNVIVLDDDRELTSV